MNSPKIDPILYELKKQEKPFNDDKTKEEKNLFEEFFFHFR